MRENSLSMQNCLNRSGLRSRRSVVQIHSGTPAYLADFPEITYVKRINSSSTKSAQCYGKRREFTPVDGGKMGESLNSREIFKVEDWLMKPLPPEVANAESDEEFLNKAANYFNNNGFKDYHWDNWHPNGEPSPSAVSAAQCALLGRKSQSEFGRADLKTTTNKGEMK